MTWYFAECIAALCMVSIGVRYGSFILPRALLETRTVALLARWLPGAIMAALVVHSLEPYSTTTPRMLGAIVGCLVVVAAHLWRRNFLLSILAGTLVYIGTQHLW